MSSATNCTITVTLIPAKYMFRGVPHHHFSAGMFIRGLPVHRCSVENSPFSATSDLHITSKSPIDWRSTWINKPIISEQLWKISNISKLQRFIKQGTKINIIFFWNTKQKVRKNGCWLQPMLTFETPKLLFQPKCLLTRAQVKIRFKWY